MSKPLHTIHRRNGQFYWSKPFHGVTHCGDVKSGTCWVTAIDYGTFSVFDKFDWRKDKLVYTPSETVGSIAEAKAEAEKWLASCGY